MGRRGTAVLEETEGRLKAMDACPRLLSTPGAIRTHDLELRRFLLYPAELQGHCAIIACAQTASKADRRIAAGLLRTLGGTTGTGVPSGRTIMC
jgi:hypothetical protein